MKNIEFKFGDNDLAYCMYNNKIAVGKIVGVTVAQGPIGVTVARGPSTTTNVVYSIVYRGTTVTKQRRAEELYDSLENLINNLKKDYENKDNQKDNS